MSIPTIKDWRITLQTIKERYVAEQLNSISETNKWDTIDRDGKARIFEGIDQKYYADGYSTWIIKLTGANTSTRLDFLREVTATPMETKLKLAWMYAISDHVGDTFHGFQGFHFDYDDIEIRFNHMTQYGVRVADREVQAFDIVRLNRAAQEAVITKENIKSALVYYDKLKVMLGVLERNYGNNQATESEGFKKLMDQRPKVETETETIALREQIEEYKKLLTNNLTARTWGFEIEVPDAKDVSAPNGIEKGEDGSLRSYESNDSCECDCDSCFYHECDCEYCETGSSEPDHDCGSNACSQADMAEYRSIGGIQRMRHAGMIELCEELNKVDAEKNDSAGTHIHVWARDLTAAQIGQVMAIYQWNYWILSAIAGRENVNYAKRIPNTYITRLLSKKKPELTLDKPVAVNLTPLFSSRGTIEFRQMDCNLDQDLILFWAWLVRGIVNAAKRGAHFSDFKQVKDLRDIVTVLDKYNHTLYNETPEDIVYGSRTDEGRVVQPTLVQYSNR